MAGVENSIDTMYHAESKKFDLLNPSALHFTKSYDIQRIPLDPRAALLRNTVSISTVVRST